MRLGHSPREEIIKPYYQDKHVTIYLGDCREIAPTLGRFDLLLTDPPYPDYLQEEYGYVDGIIDFASHIDCRQFIFWSAKYDFPLDFTAIHIWDKKTGCGSEYERIFERNGQKNFKMFRHYLINSTVAASFTGDQWTGHPSQKPVKLIKELLTKTDAKTILDPFAGSGTTGRAAKDLGLQCTLIEREERYCEIAANRIRGWEEPIVNPFKGKKKGLIF